MYYGVQTLLQMVERDANGNARLPYATVHDWPELAYRGTLMDAGSEGPMLTFEEVEKQIDFLAKWKDNQYFFYSEGNIEMRGYPLLNPKARFTQQQIREIVAYARERHIDVIPAVEMYGHLHDLFRIEKYSDLADFPHGGELNPSSEKAHAMLEDWANQLEELFPSKFVDIGFDETWSLQKNAEHAGSKFYTGAVVYPAAHICNQPLPDERQDRDGVRRHHGEISRHRATASKGFDRAAVVVRTRFTSPSTSAGWNHSSPRVSRTS